MEDKKKQWEKLNRNCLARIFRGSYAEAIQDGTEAVKLAAEIFGDPSPELADSQKNLAMAHFYNGSPEDIAKPLREQSLHTAEQIIDKAPGIAAEVIHQYGAVLHQLMDYENAEIYYKRALDIRKSKGISPHIIAKSLGDLARLYGDTGRTDEGENLALESKNMLGEYLKKLTDKTSDEYLEATYDYAINSNNVGYNYEMKKQYEPAGENYAQAVDALVEYVRVGGRPEAALMNNFYGNIQGLRESWAAGIDDMGALLDKLDQL
jgi:tetratricopeptide (TPR) repeat protein